MSEAKHTPGPWAAKHTTGAGWSVKMAKPRPDYTEPDPVCSMAWWQFDKPGIIDDEISGANAKLIAAAPDLLAACEACIAADEMANADGTLGDDMVAAYDAAIAAAKAAIAKAKGE